MISGISPVFSPRSAGAAAAANPAPLASKLQLGGNPLSPLLSRTTHWARSCCLKLLGPSGPREVGRFTLEDAQKRISQEEFAQETYKDNILLRNRLPPPAAQATVTWANEPGR
jgi:hypothetical protein